MGGTQAQSGPLGAQFEITQIPVVGMRGDDDFFTRDQMGVSLLQTACPSACAASPLRWGAQSERTAGPVPAVPRTSLIPQTAGELPKPSSLCARSTGLAAATVVLRLALPNASNYKPSVGAMCTRRARKVQPSPAEPFTPPLLLLLPPTRRSSLPTSPGPPAALRSTGCSAVPPDRGRGMKILIRNLSPSRTHCQERANTSAPASSITWCLSQCARIPPPTPKETSNM